jgi:hypothetical protein
MTKKGVKINIKFPHAQVTRQRKETNMRIALGK